MDDLLLALVVAAILTAVLAGRVAARAVVSERRYRALAAHWPETAIALLDRGERFVHFEGDALRPHWQSGEVLGRRLADVLPADRYAELRPRVEAALRGEGGALDWAGVRSEGRFRVDVVPFRETGQEVTHTMLAIRDIAQEKVLQRSLEEQSGFLSAVLRELGERVLVSDADGRIVDFGSPHTAGRAGLHPLEWAETFGLLHPDGRRFGPHEAPLLRALRGEDVRDVEMQVDTAEGTLSMLASGGPVLTPEGRRLGAVVVNTDLTAFREAEGRLRRSEDRHRRVVESMVDCVFETDASGCWTYLSENWTTATGHGVAETLGRPATEYVHPLDLSAVVGACAPLTAGERADARLRHRFLTVTGAERWADVQVRAISGWDGLPTSFVGVMRDVTGATRAAQHSAAESAVMRLLSSAHGPELMGPGLVAELARELGWDGAELWQMGDDERLHRTAAWTAPGVDLARFLAAGAELGLEVGDGTAGQAWMSRVPLFKPDITVEATSMLPRRLKEAVADGIRSTAALPLRGAGVPVGVVVLVSRTPREPEPGLVRLMEAVGGHVNQFLQRRDAEQRVATQAEDLKMLSAVAHQLAGQSDHFGARMTLTRAVRELASAATVTLWEPTEAGDELEVSASVGAALRGMTASLGVRSGLGTAFHTGDLGFAADVTTDPRVKFRWHELTGAHSGAWVPVLQDDRVLAVMAVSWNTPRARLTEREEGLLRLLAAEAAITIQRTDLMVRLQATARTDALTGLPNRRVWDEDLEREVARAARHGGELCLAMVDLDRFKAFNDRHGHQSGDELLAATAAAWRPALRATDTLARYGGEEFAVLLPHSDQHGAMVVVERLLEVVPLGQTASAGVAVWDGAETAAQLLARADAALYEAKHAGRARALLAS